MSRNGRLDVETELEEVSGVLLAPATARAFVAMADACLASTGVRLDIVNGGGGYRSLDYQRSMYANRAKFLPIRIAKPGSSTHGLGTALDLTTTCYTQTVERWCRNHCREFGFAIPPSGDRRHFQHDGISRSIPATTNNARLTERRKAVTTMFVKASTATPNAGPGTIWAMAGDVGTPCPGNWFEFTRAYKENVDPFDKGRILAAAHGSAVYLSDPEWEERKKAYTTPASAGALVIDDTAIAKLAKANAEAFFLEQKKPGN